MRGHGLGKTGLKLRTGRQFHKSKCIRRGVFRSVKELEETIMEYIEYHNEDPSPFIWTAQACDILEKVTRAKGKLLNQ